MNDFKSRKELRIQDQLKAKFKNINEKNAPYHDGTVLDISRSGLFINTEATFDMETKLVVHIYLPDEEFPVEFVGQVSRTSEKTKNAHRGIGIKIQNIQQGDKERLLNFFELSNIYGWFC